MLHFRGVSQLVCLSYRRAFVLFVVIWLLARKRGMNLEGIPTLLRSLRILNFQRYAERLLVGCLTKSWNTSEYLPFLLFLSDRKLLYLLLYIEFYLLVTVKIWFSLFGNSRVIWLGDLNYRIALSYTDTRKLLEGNDWDALLGKDQVIHLPTFSYH